MNPRTVLPLFFGVRPVTWVILLLACSALSRLVICMSIPILPDEAYYFLWSKHLDASYFSKGPAIAWTIWAGTTLFGNNVLGVRIFSVLLSAGTGWQVFLLARRWFDEVTGLLAVLLICVVPLYSLGAVLMTIDPLSAFFWVWAANFFTSGWDIGQNRYWALAGFAIGAGFLAKYLNGLELTAMLAFCLRTRPSDQARQVGLTPIGIFIAFSIMLLVGIASIFPVLVWNQAHGWPTIHHLIARADLGHWWEVNLGLVRDFLVMQLIVISPGLFLFLIYEGCVSFHTWWHRSESRPLIGTRLMHALFLSVFLFYLILSFHHACEPNWPAISYFSLIIVLAHRAKRWLNFPAFSWAKLLLVLAFLLADGESVAFHSTRLLPLPHKMDPFSRFEGWSELAAEVQKWRVQLGNPEMLADAYKEASVVSFNLPDQQMVFSLRSAAPASQFDMWPGIAGTRALYFSESDSADRVRADYKKVTVLEHFQFTYRGQRLRDYYLYLIEK